MLLGAALVLVVALILPIPVSAKLPLGVLLPLGSLAAMAVDVPARVARRKRPLTDNPPRYLAQPTRKTPILSVLYRQGGLAA